MSHSENVDYIVMELIDGITLKQYMEQKQVLNWREALHFATQIAKALEHAHSSGIIHRDIKPHNIMAVSYTHLARRWLRSLRRPKRASIL